LRKRWVLKMYRVEFSQKALEQMEKLDNYTSMLIISWIRKNLEGCVNPYLHGKGEGGQWRYRIGDYRLLAEIQEAKIIIMILSVGH